MLQNSNSFNNAMAMFETKSRSTSSSPSPHRKKKRKKKKIIKYAYEEKDDAVQPPPVVIGHSPRNSLSNHSEREKQRRHKTQHQNMYTQQTNHSKNGSHKHRQSDSGNMGS